MCVLDAPRKAKWMQQVAAEMNLSETAFLEPRDDGWGLRWFTPAVEIELCGHATLASAHVLYESGRLGVDETAHFHTMSGLLKAERRSDWIVLDFPAHQLEATELPPALAGALGVLEPVDVRHVPTGYAYLIELPDEATLRGLRPDFAAMKQVAEERVIVTCQAESADFDFVSRFFGPTVGVDEDPVTGSAHCALAPYWAERLCKEELSAFQASERGGVLRVRLVGDRVELHGQAVSVVRGELV